MDPRPRRLVVPAELARLQEKHNGATGRTWIAALPELAESIVEQWELRVIGAPRHGMGALVLPVRRADGTSVVLKLQAVDEESAGEPDALRAWNGAASARLLAHDPATGSMLLERLDPERTLAAVPDDHAALTILSGLLARLVAVPPPPGIRHLADIAADMLDRVPPALSALADPADRRLLTDCAAVVTEVLGEPGDALLHWDLHYDNVLHSLPGSDREPWLAIDPKPLVGDPGFDLLPALDNRWAEIAAAPSPRAAVLARFDLMTEILALDRARAAAWTLGRVLQNSLWEIEDGGHAVDEIQTAVAEAMFPVITTSRHQARNFT